MPTTSHPDTAVSPSARLLSPRRKTTAATTVAELAAEQLAHFNLDPASPVGVPLLRLAERLYHASDDLTDLWEVTLRELGRLPRGDRLALFNLKSAVETRF
jgi:hypothetical protein